jgi:hypothetical protein
LSQLSLLHGDSGLDGIRSSLSLSDGLFRSFDARIGGAFCVLIRSQLCAACIADCASFTIVW